MSSKFIIWDRYFHDDDANFTKLSRILFATLDPLDSYHLNRFHRIYEDSRTYKCMNLIFVCILTQAHSIFYNNTVIFKGSCFHCNHLRCAQVILFICIAFLRCIACTAYKIVFTWYFLYIRILSEWSECCKKTSACYKHWICKCFSWFAFF